MVEICTGKTYISEERMGNEDLPNRCRREPCRGFHHYAYYLQYGTRWEAAESIYLLRQCAYEDTSLRERVIWLLNRYAQATLENDRALKAIEFLQGKAL